MSDLLARITIDPDERSGRPCIRGLGITVHDILGWMAASMTETEILTDYNQLEPEDLRAALVYAAAFFSDGGVATAA